MFKEIYSKLLEDRGLTAYKVSQETGISNGNLSEYKSGVKIPSNKNLQKLSEFFGVSVDYLLTGQEPTPAEIVIPEELKNVRVAFHRGEFEDLTQDEVDKLAEFAKFIKSQRGNE